MGEPGGGGGSTEGASRETGELCPESGHMSPEAPKPKASLIFVLIILVLAVILCKLQWFGFRV